MYLRVRNAIAVFFFAALIVWGFWNADTLRGLVGGALQGNQTAAVLTAIRSSLVAQKLPVVFVHGINDSGATWAEMKTHLKSLGWTDDLLYANTFSCAALAGCSNVTNASEIATWVNKASADHGGKQVILIAHSMGGVSSRYFLTNNAARSKVAAVVTLASMNNGLPLTCPASGFKLLGLDIGATICNELARTGAFMNNLAVASYESAVPSLNVYSTGDATVSTYAARVKGACNARIQGVSHPDVIRTSGLTQYKDRLTAFLQGSPYSGICEPDPVQPTVPQLANGTKKFLLVPVMFADTVGYEQRSPLQLDAIFGVGGLVPRYFTAVSKGKLAFQFARVDREVRLPGNLFPLSFGLYASIGGIAGEGDLIRGASVFDGTANAVDKALCGSTVGGQKINLADYDGIALVYQDTLLRHFAAQRIEPGMFERWRDGHGIALGIANTVPVTLHDCPTGDSKEFQYKSILSVFTGATWSSDQEVALTAVHELGHTIGFGHSGTYFDPYGNRFDLMGYSKYASAPGGLLQSLAQWSTPVGNLRPVSVSGKYTVNSVESGLYPAGLSFSYGSGSTRVVLERHDGTDATIPLVTEAPKVSGLLQVSPRLINSGAWNTPIYIENNQTLTFDQDGLAKGGCDVLDLGTRSAVYRYNTDGSIDVKFTDDSNYTDGAFGCGVDLQVLNVWISKPPRVGVPVTVTAQVRNLGDKKADASYAAHLTSETADSLVMVQEVRGSALAVGKQETLTFSWTPTISGNTQLKVFAEIANDVNTRNNNDTLNTFVEPPAGQPVPTGPVKQSITIAKLGGGGGVTTILISKNSSTKSFQCDFTIPCTDYPEIGSRITLTTVPNASVAFTTYGGDYCSGLKTCSFEVAGAGTVTVGLVPTATVLLEKAGSGKDFGDIALSYMKPGDSVPTVCGSDCTGKQFTVVAGSQLSATAIPELNQNVFFSWAGCTPTGSKEVCSATAPAVGKSLTITANYKKLVPISFVPQGDLFGTVTYKVQEPGWSVASEVKSNAPLATFTEKRPEGSVVTFTYVPPADTATSRVRLFSWASSMAPYGCTATSNICSFTLGSEEVKSGFTTKYQYRVQIAHADANGSVSLEATAPNQGGITCPATNTANPCGPGEWYWKGSTLTATARPNEWYDFNGWNAGACGGAGTRCVQSNLSAALTIRANAFKEHTWRAILGPGCVPGQFIGSIDFRNVYCGKVSVDTSINGVLRRTGLWGETYAVGPLAAKTDRLGFRVYSCSSCFHIRVDRYLEGPNKPYTFDATNNETAGLDVYDKYDKNGYATLDSYERRVFWGTYDSYDATALDTSAPREVYAANDPPSSSERKGLARAGVLPQGELMNRLQRGLASVFMAFVNPPKIAAALPILDPQPRMQIVYGNPLSEIGEAVSSMWSFVRHAATRLVRVGEKGGDLAAVVSATLSGSPDLVARHIYVNDCDSNCVLKPGELVTLTAFISNESFMATTQPFGARLTVHNQAHADATKDLQLYRYFWKGIGTQTATSTSWGSEWLPANGTYTLTLAVDDWKNLDPVDANDRKTLTVTVSDTPLTLTTGVRDAFGGRVGVQGDAVSAVTCTAASCVSTPTQGSAVQLTAVPDTNRRFVGWEGARAVDCVTHNFATSTCHLSMTTAKVIQAYFETDGPLLNITVDSQQGGSGKVSSINTGGARDITNCGTVCSRPFVADSTVTLTAAADAGSYFSQWAGVDAERCVIGGGGNVCTLKVKNGEPSEIRPLFVKGTVPKQKVTIRTYSTVPGATGVVRILDPQNADALLHTCSAESCSYLFDVPSAAGRPLKVVPVPLAGSVLDKFISPVVDLTPDGRFSSTGCGELVMNEERLKDLDTTTWFTCAGAGRINYSSEGTQRVTSVEAYMPSLSRAVDAGAYEATIKRALGAKAGIAPTDPLITYNTGGLSGIVSDIIKLQYTPSNNLRQVAQTGALPVLGAKSSSVYMHTTGYASSVSGTLEFRIRTLSGASAKAWVSVEMPGIAYTDEQLNNVLVERYIPTTGYTTVATLPKGVGPVTVSFPGIEASSLSFRSANVNPIRIGELKFRGTFRNPCTDNGGGVCGLTLLKSSPIVVPVSFTTGSAAGVFGDVTGDSKVTASDALAALKMAVGQMATTTAADVNCDTRVVASDALAILQTAVGSRTLTSCAAVQASANYGYADVQVISSGAAPASSLGTVDLSLAQSGTEYVYTGTVKLLSPTAVFSACGGDCVRTSPTTFTLTTSGGLPKMAYVYLRDGAAVAELTTAPVLETLLVATSSDPIATTSIQAIEKPKPVLPKATAASTTKPQVKIDPVIKAPPQKEVPATTTKEQVKKVDGLEEPAKIPVVVTEPARKPAAVASTSVQKKPAEVVSLGVTTAAKLTNLTLTSLTTIPATPRTSRPFMVRAVVKNTSATPILVSTTVAVRVDLQGDGVWDTIDIQDAPPLQAGMAYPVTFKKSATLAATGVIQVCVDDTARIASSPSTVASYLPGPIPEADEADNCSNVTVVPSDRVSLFTKSGTMAAALLSGADWMGVVASVVSLGVLLGMRYRMRRW